MSSETKRDFVLSRAFLFVVVAVVVVSNNFSFLCVCVLQVPVDWYGDWQKQSRGISRLCLSSLCMPEYEYRTHYCFLDE